MSNENETIHDRDELEPIKLDKLSFKSMEASDTTEVEAEIDSDHMDSDHIDSGEEELDKKGRKKKKNKKRKKEVQDEPVSAPNQMMIGFYSNVKKKDVERFIRSRAESKMSLKTAWYNIVKYDDGFAWELHDGGSGKSVLKSVISILEYEPQVVIRLSSETIKITKRTNHSGLVAFRIPDSEEVQETAGVQYSETMKPVLKSGLGLFVTGLVFAVLGILSVFLASMFKFVILNENEPYQHAKQITDLPISQIDKLQEVVKIEGIFIQSVNYSNGKWQINTGSEEPQSKPSKTSSSEKRNASSSTSEESSDEMVQLSRSIDNSNKNNVNNLPPEIEQQLGSGNSSASNN